MAYSPEKRKEYSKSYYEANKKVYQARYQANREALIKATRDKTIVNREYIQAYKEANPCTDCGKFFHYCVMEFDHIDSENKLSDISKLMSSPYKLKKILDEIAKCELVCANCHRIRTCKRLHPEKLCRR